MNREICAEADSLGVDPRIVGRAIGRHPSLRSRLSALARNAPICARILAVKRSEFIRMALAAPGLIDLPVARLMANIREGPSYLRISPERFRQLGLKTPFLFSLSPEELHAHVAMLAQTLDCEEERIRRLIIRAPEMIVWPLNRWLQKRREIGAALGLNDEQVNLMILRHPTILKCRPATLKAHADGLMSLLRLSKADLDSLLVRMPTLLSVKPGLLASKLPKLNAIGQLYDGISARDIVMMLPAALAYSHERLKQRRELALFGEPRPILSRLLTMSSEEAKHLISGERETLPRKRSRHRS